MKIGFRVKEKLYASVNFEVECDDQDDIQNILDQMLDDMVNAEDLYCELCEIYGDENVKCYGLNDTDNICSEDELEFDDWEEPV